MDIEKWCPKNVLTVIFTVGCIIGIYLAFKTLTTSSMSLFERVAEGVMLPLSSGFVLCCVYSVAAFFVSYIVENHMKQKTFFALVVIACIAIGLFFAFTITE